MEIEFHGQYDKKSFMKAVSLASKPSKRNALIRLGISFIFVLIFAAYFINLAMEDNLSSFELLRSSRHVISILILVYFIFQPNISAYIVALRLWKDPSTRKPLAGAISGQGITFFTSTNGRREKGWESYVKKRTTEDMLVLLSAAGELTYFTRQFFNNDEDWKKVVQWANFKVMEAT